MRGFTIVGAATTLLEEDTGCRGAARGVRAVLAAAISLVELVEEGPAEDWALLQGHCDLKESTKL